MARSPVYGIGICAGAHGLELGLEIAIPGYRAVCMVEREVYPSAAMAARCAEGSLSPYAQWDDVATFDGTRWRGLIHIVSAGFPCQPFSVAGKRGGTSDERWIWPDIARVIGECEPDGVFLENVPGLLRDAQSDVDRWDVESSPDDALGGMGTILRDLADLGFSAEWGCVRAADVGASHGRKRVFILAYSQNFIGRSGVGGTQTGTWTDGIGRRGSAISVGELGDTEGQRRREGRTESAGLEGGLDAPEPDGAMGNSGCEPEQSQQRRVWPEHPRTSGAVEYAGIERHERDTGSGREAITRAEYASGEFRSLVDAIGGVFAPGPEDSRWSDVLVRNPWLRPALAQAEAQPDLCNLADGMADILALNRTDALRCAGNGVVVLQAAVAFVLLSRRF